jgi:hypothetical protein
MRASITSVAIGASLLWPAVAGAQVSPGEIENPFVRAAYCTAAADQAENFDTYGDWVQVVFVLYGSAYARDHEALYVTPPTVEPSVVADHDAACTALLPGFKAEAAALAEAAGPRVEIPGEPPRATPEEAARAIAAIPPDAAHCFALAGMLSQGLQADPELYGFERGEDALEPLIADVGTLFQTAQAAAASAFDSIEEMQMAAQDAWIAIDAAAGGRREALFGLYGECSATMVAAP